MLCIISTLFKYILIMDQRSVEFQILQSLQKTQLPVTLILQKNSNFPKPETQLDILQQSFD